jgi:hypothetical protein
MNQVMKLRLHGNSVRLRLTRPDVERLRQAGVVEEPVEFGSGEVLAYRLQSRQQPGPVEALFRDGVMTVTVPEEAAQPWAGSDEVGLYARNGSLSISIEKDFRCLTRPLEDERERDAYPHPAQRS